MFAHLNKQLDIPIYSNQSTVKRKFLHISTSNWTYLEMQFGLQLKDCFCTPQQVTGHTNLKENMDPTREQSTETVERIVIFMVSVQSSAPKDNRCFQRAVSKIWCKYNETVFLKNENILVDNKRHESVNDRKLKAKYIENRKCTIK